MGSLASPLIIGGGDVIGIWLLAVVMLAPLTASAQRQPAVRFAHTGSFALSMDDDGEMNLPG